MITSEEREEIINAAVERAILKIPDVVGNLIMNYSAKIRASEEFYKKYPEFKVHRKIVAAAIEETEGEDFSIPYEEIISRAIPKIKKRIKKLDGIDVKSVKQPSTDFSHGEL